MKKIFALILAAFLATSLIACGNDDNTNTGTPKDNNVVEEENISGDFKYAVNADGDYEITAYIYGGTELQDVVVPAEIGGRPVTGIGADAFKASKNIRSVTFEGAITYIGQYAFYDCDELTAITVPATVKTIGMGAFQNCDQLATATLNAGLTDIGSFAFLDCKALTGVVLPEGLVTIGKSAFNGTALTAITIPTTVTTIDDAAFSNCNALATVTAMGEVTTIGASLFYNCAETMTFHTTANSAFDQYVIEQGYKEVNK